MITPGFAANMTKLLDFNTGIPFVKMHPAAQKPERAKSGDVGFDLKTVEAAVLYSGDDPVPIDTGIGIELPDNMFALVAPRSGLGKRGMLIHGGVIDAGYRGNIIVLASKTGKGWIEFAPGDKIAQLLILPRYITYFVEIEKLSESERGADGFGSTDKSS